MDIPTLSFCSMLSSCAFAAVFLALWQRRRSERHLLYWSISNWVYAFTIVAFQSSAASSLFVSIVLSALAGLSDILVVSGVYKLDGTPPFRRWMTVPIAAEIIGVAAPFFIGSSAPALAQLCSAAGSSIALGASGFAILREDDRFAASRGRRLAAFALLAYLPGYAAALVGQIYFHSSVDLFTLIPTVSDQLLLSILNLGLLAIPTERAHQRLREAASRDYLTGALNRNGLAAYGAAPAPGTAIIALDIDHFKQINDQHGHAFGDTVLITVARTVLRLVEPRGGQLFRTGGDEFVAIIPNVAEREAIAIAQRIQDLLAAAPATPATVSIGVAVACGEGADLTKSVTAADEALYRAKALGRNHVSV